MNNPPYFFFQKQASTVLEKILQFSRQAYHDSSWTADCLADVERHGGYDSLSIRVIEHWDYRVGGALADPMHYDENSVLTIVALLSDEKELEGGQFRTHESDGTHLVHEMKQGDVLCLVSHKYHNVTEVIVGFRNSLVVELWQGTNSEGGR